MRVVFAVPYALETTLRFVRGAAALPGVRLGVVSQEPLERLPQDVRRRVAAHRRVADTLDAAQLEGAVRGLGEELGGPVERLVGVLEQLQVPLAEVRERLGIRGMDASEAANFRDKARMKDALRAAGLPCARHRLATSAAEGLEFARRNGYPLVVKPPAGAGAKNTFRVTEQAQLESWFRTAPPSAQAPVMLEEFVVGREHSFDSVSLNGRHVFHSISRYYPTPLEVMENPGVQWCVVLPRSIDGPEYRAILEAGPRALDALRMVTGITHMEWFRREDGSVAISEVAARPPGAQFTTLLSVAHDHDFYRAWSELLIFERFRVPERRFAAGAIFLRGRGEGKVARVRGLREVEERLGALVVDSKLPRKGQERGDTYEGDGYVVLRHPETEAVEEGLRLLLSRLTIELE